MDIRLRYLNSYGGFKYYLNPDGCMVVNEEIVIGGEKYYAGADGKLGRA